MENKLKATLELSTTDLHARRKALREEIKETTIALINTEVKRILQEIFDEEGIEKVSSVSFDTYPESDDEGGSYQRIEYIRARTVEDEDIDLDEHGLYDAIYDTLSDYSEEIYEYGIWEVELAPLEV